LVAALRFEVAWGFGPLVAFLELAGIALVTPVSPDDFHGTSITQSGALVKKGEADKLIGSK
jgi:hypothetical protein